MKRTAVDLESGTVVFGDRDCIDDACPLPEQCDHLKEDLAQIIFPGEIVLDIGWYPSFDPHREFVVMVVRNADWEKPSFRAVAKDLPALCQIIHLGISAAKG